MSEGASTSKPKLHVVETPLQESTVLAMRAGDPVLLSGRVYTARDAAHRRLVARIEAGEELPIDLVGQVIYYCGPTPAPEGRPIGSAGPTTASRMDAYAPTLHELGLRATIGKGDRSLAVREALQRHRAIYLAAVGGAGALLARTIRSARVVAEEDLGPEAIRELVLEQFPAIVAYDAHGGSVFAR